MKRSCRQGGRTSAGSRNHLFKQAGSRATQNLIGRTVNKALRASMPNGLARLAVLRFGLLAFKYTCTAPAAVKAIPLQCASTHLATTGRRSSACPSRLTLSCLVHPARTVQTCRLRDIPLSTRLGPHPCRTAPLRAACVRTPAAPGCGHGARRRSARPSGCATSTAGSAARTARQCAQGASVTAYVRHRRCQHAL